MVTASLVQVLSRGPSCGLVLSSCCFCSITPEKSALSSWQPRALSAGLVTCVRRVTVLRGGPSLICWLVKKRPKQWDIEVFNQLFPDKYPTFSHLSWLDPIFILLTDGCLCSGLCLTESQSCACILNKPFVPLRRLRAVFGWENFNEAPNRAIIHFWNKLLWLP